MAARVTSAQPQNRLNTPELNAVPALLHASSNESAPLIVFEIAFSTYTIGTPASATLAPISACASSRKSADGARSWGLGRLVARVHTATRSGRSRSIIST